MPGSQGHLEAISPSKINFKAIISFQLSLVQTFLQKSELAESLNSEDNVRIVYLLTVNGRAVRQLKRLIRKLFDGRNYFYVHVDARQDFMFSEIKKLADKFPEHIRVAENRVRAI